MKQQACRLIVRLEGVVTQSADSALLSALGGVGAVDAMQRIRLRDLASRLRAGEIEWTGLCTQAAALARSAENGGALGARVLGSFRADPGIAELLASLAGVLDTWLFCEIAEPVIRPALERLALDRLVPPGRWLFSAGQRPRLRIDEPRQLAALLEKRVKAPREKLLWVDDRPSVTAALIRAGMNAVAFVDAFRLRRNLVLRGFVQ